MFPFGFMESPAMRKRRLDAEAQIVARRLSNVAHWTPDMKWAPELNLSAESYQRQLRRLFDVKPSSVSQNPVHLPDDQRVVSCDEHWIYCENTVPRGRTLSTILGRKKGDVMWDGEVVIPSIYETRRLAWDLNPWMSLTPMEFMTLRVGTRFARGHVVIAGLGLGHQLIECSTRKRVERITLVEHSRSLVDFIMPHVRRFLGCPVEVVIDDARDVVPKMTADVALIDIFPHYGGNDFKHCPSIKRVWCWGSAP